MQTKISKGIVYFDKWEHARDFAVKHCKGFPAWRLRTYELGVNFLTWERGPATTYAEALRVVRALQREGRAAYVGDAS